MVEFKLDKEQLKKQQRYEMMLDNLPMDAQQEYNEALERAPLREPSLEALAKVLQPENSSSPQDTSSPSPQGLLDAMQAAHPGATRESLLRIAEDAGFV